MKHSWTLANLLTDIFQIPPALIFALLPRFYSGLSGPGAKLFDRNSPRSFPDTLKNADLDEGVNAITRTYIFPF